MAESASRRPKDQSNLPQRKGKLCALAVFVECSRTAVLTKLDIIPSLQDMKLRYYELMIKLALHEDNYLDACKAWQEVWDTEEVKNNEQQNMQVSRINRCKAWGITDGNHYLIRRVRLGYGTYHYFHLSCSV